MKNITIAAFVLLSFPVLAESNRYDDPQEFCNDMSSLASSIMKARQAGVAMSKLIESAKELPPAQAIVVSAYKKPRMSVEANQQRMIDDFANEYYLECYQALVEGD